MLENEAAYPGAGGGDGGSLDVEEEETEDDARVPGLTSEWTPA